MFSLSVAELQDRHSGIYNALTSLWQSYGRGVQNSACSPLADCGLGACSPLADCGLGACSPLADCGLGAQESIRFQHSVAEFRSRCSGIYMFSLLCGRVLFQVFRDQHVLTSVW